MANFNADIATQQASIDGATRVDGSLYTGKRLVMRATYVFVGTEAANDTLTFGALPNGARLTAAKLFTEGVGGTTGTIATLGTLASASLYSSTAAAITAAGVVSFTLVAGLAPAAADGSTAIVGTLGLASGAFTAAKTLQVDFEYFI